MACVRVCVEGIGPMYSITQSPVPTVYTYTQITLTCTSGSFIESIHLSNVTQRLRTYPKKNCTVLFDFGGIIVLRLGLGFLRVDILVSACPEL